MALRPPEDFRPGISSCRRPSLGQLWEAWEARAQRDVERERSAWWRQTVEGVRRADDGDLVVLGPSQAGFLRGGAALGRGCRSGLRRRSGYGRVFGAGVDTWSPCWYVESGSAAARAMAGLATQVAGRAVLVPGRVFGYRVGWFPDWGLVFAEGCPDGGGLCVARGLVAAYRQLVSGLADLGVPLSRAVFGGLRRLDVAVDLWMGSAAEGLAFLECLGGASLGGKVATYRGGRCVESVLLKTARGRSRARVYDKGRESGRAAAGRWLRFEAQWRFQQGSRPLVGEIDAGVLRERFRLRFGGLWEAVEGIGVGGLGLVVDRVSEAVEGGRLRPSRARSVVGYLVLGSVGVGGGARRTEYELERECRELGLTMSWRANRRLEVDVGQVFEECLAPEVWGVSG